jgi:tetratricopeptide (TPR) repeat protein
MIARLRLGASVGLVLWLAACASAPPPPPVVTVPRFPGYPMPSVPPRLAVARDVIDRHDVAWRRFQSGDLRGAARDFETLLKEQPAFYPAEAGLGFLDLAERDFRSAATRFAEVVERDDRYLPAWIGRAEAETELNNDAQAIAAMERVLALDPTRENIKNRLELVRFRQLQSLLGEGRRERQAGRLDAAGTAFERALALSPQSPVILRELAEVELAAGRVNDAETHLRRALEIDSGDAEAHRALAEVLDARGLYRDAAASYSRAVAIDPRPEWRKAAAALSEKADLAALPKELSDLANAATLTRAHMAAYIGSRLGTVIDAAPQRTAVVATDVGRHWAAPWIFRVTRAGIMSVFPNHTFQPAATVRRGDLAQTAAELLSLAAARRPADLAGWRAAQPKFSDLPTGNVFYRPAALAVAAGVMAVDASGRFRPTEPATGADLTRAVTRIGQLSGR